MEPEANVKQPHTGHHTEDDLPATIPAMELRGTPQDKLRSLDAAIAQLQQLRSSFPDRAPAMRASSELHGRYINAPVWPWFTAGWVLGALFALLFVLAYEYAA